MARWYVTRSANVRVRFEESGDASERRKPSNIPAVMGPAAAQTRKLRKRRHVIRPEAGSDFFCIGWGFSGTEAGVCKIGFIATSEKFRVKLGQDGCAFPTDRVQENPESA